AGHAIVGRLVAEHDPVYKVSIIPRGRALGITMFLPEEDRYSHTKRGLQCRIATLYGGRIAEELIFGEEMVTTGASSDIERATEIARNMVTRWGLSEKLGPLAYSEEEGEVFLGRSTAKQNPMSAETVMSIDSEIRKLIDDNYQVAETILKDNMDIMHAMADALLQYETIDLGQIDRLMERREPGPPADWGGDSGGKPPAPTSLDKKPKDEDVADDDAADPADPSPSLH
ncbi:MAG: cell division protease FtsH, partial [Granulosicoccus sp.]